MTDALRLGEPTRTGRAAPSWALLVLGYASIIAGGLIAAVTGPLELAHGSWVAAYLVLVGGVAQLALGWVPGELGQPSTGTRGWLVVAGWNLGNLVVIAATLTGWPVRVDLGSVLLVLALVVALVRLRGWRTSGQQPDRVRLLLGWCYLGLLVLLVVSIPVGIVLAHLR